MLILSIGIGVLAGTVLSAWNPASSPFVAASTQGIKQASSVPGAPAPTNSGPSQLQLTQEIAPLKAKLEALLQQYSGFTPGVFLLDLDSNNYLDLSGTHSFAAASTIKVPILIALFQEVDAGKIRLDEKLTLTKEMIAQGSGDMQYLQPGSQFTVLDVATKMIIISDNTATNMLIARLGGLSALNQRFNSWGLTETILNSVLPDLKGTNVTSPKELTSLMVRVSQGDLVSLRSRDRILDIMRRTVNNSQLPQGLGEGATIAHKTGDIGTLIGDVGLVDMPNGKRYVATVLVKRAFNDDRAYDLIQKISRTIYQHLSGSATVSDAISTPSPSAAAGAQSSQADADPGNTEAQHSPHHPITPEQAPSHSNPMQASTQQ
jgi:beta-lactamase class A